MSETAKLLVAAPLRPRPARGLGNIRLTGQAHLGEHLAGGRLDRLQDAALSSRPAAAENPGLPFGPAEQRDGLVLSCAWLPAASLVRAAERPLALL